MNQQNLKSKHAPHKIHFVQNDYANHFKKLSMSQDTPGCPMMSQDVPRCSTKSHGVPRCPTLPTMSNAFQRCPTSSKVVQRCPTVSHVAVQPRSSKILFAAFGDTNRTAAQFLAWHRFPKINQLINPWKTMPITRSHHEEVTTQETLL